MVARVIEESGQKPVGQPVVMPRRAASPIQAEAQWEQGTSGNGAAMQAGGA